MDHFAKLVAATLLGAACFTVHAGYAQLAPPSGWSAGGGAGGSFNVPAAAANGASYSGGNVLSNPSLGVGGRAVTVPAASRMAANAGRIAAAAAYAFPAARAALAVAGWIAAAGFLYNAGTGLWEKMPAGSDPIPPGHEIFYSVMGALGTNPNSACAAYAAKFGGTVTLANENSCVIKWADNQEKGYSVQKAGKGACPGSWYFVDGVCVQTPNAVPVSQPEFVDGVSANPIPDGVPEHIPVPLPVDLPSVQPTFIPTGNPVKNPDYNPNAAPSPTNQPWNQPGIRVTPSPTVENPWQVDAVPVNRPVPTGVPNPNPVPEGEGTGNGDKPKEDEPQDLCEKHPEILACQKLDDPGDKDLERVERPISITPDSGWGAEDASCPAPRIIHAQGRQIPIPFDLFCTYMRGLRPIIIAMAWLSAAFILLGARESSA